MNNLYQTYFANVRWPELILAIAVAALGKLQLTVQGGGKIDQHALLEAGGVGLSVGWAYLRMPKTSEPAPPIIVDDLPLGVDNTGPAHDIPADVATEVVQKALGPVAAVAPDLAGNIVAELGRVLKRGIRW